MPDINRAYSWAIETCNAPNVGYSQAYRNQQTVNGITYYDCSSFIWYALVAGGFDCATAQGWNDPFTTSNMRGVLEKLGFVHVDPSGQILPGDIGWKPGHCEMCYKEGVGKAIFMGAHTASVVLANQVSIGRSNGDATYQRGDFTDILRYGSGATGYGSSLYVVAAIAGNFWQESNINPGLWEGLREGTWTELNHGFGLGQWTNTGGVAQDRLYQLHQYLIGHGFAVDSGQGQMMYLIDENIWYPVQEAATFSNLNAFLTSTSTNLEMLTHAWNIGWEGIHDSSWDLRVQYAQSCYDFILTHAQDASITDWIALNGYLTNPQILNNAVMLYRFLSAGGGGGGTFTRKGKMPLWMYCKYTY